MVAFNNYEAMFLLDNRFATRDWTECESDISAFFVKHGGEMIRARRWGERKLCYQIKGHKRATYALVYFQLPPTNISGLLRDLELSENVIRNLIQFREPEKMQLLLESEDKELLRIQEVEAAALAAAAAAPSPVRTDDAAKEAAPEASADAAPATAATTESTEAPTTESAEASTTESVEAPTTESAEAPAVETPAEAPAEKTKEEDKGTD